MEKIIVSSNCQTGGIAAALKSLFPEKIVKPIVANSEESKKSLLDELKDASVWVTGLTNELAISVCQDN